MHFSLVKHAFNRPLLNTSAQNIVQVEDHIQPCWLLSQYYIRPIDPLEDNRNYLGGITFLSIDDRK